MFKPTLYNILKAVKENESLPQAQTHFRLLEHAEDRGTTMYSFEELEKHFKLKLGTYTAGHNSDDNWFEVRVDGETVATFGPTAPFRNGLDSYTKAEKHIDDYRYSLYRDKVLQIVAVVKVQTKNEKGELSFTCDGLQETIMLEEHPTVLED